MARLTRPARGDGRVIAGVAAAVADGMGVSVFVVRALFVVAGLVGAGEILYLILWILLPKRDR
jgi:phage shock protein PspC (stress-responsive transcriptional regulator)